MRQGNDIINFELSGWPIYKMTLREIIENLGFKRESGIYAISENDPTLDIFPRVLEDDGMGYGVNEKFIVDSYSHPRSGNKSKDTFINFFVEKELDKIDLWKKAVFTPYNYVTILDDSQDEFLVKDIKEENNKLYYFCERCNNDLDNMSVCLWIDEKLLYFSYNESDN